MFLFYFSLNSFVGQQQQQQVNQQPQQQQQQQQQLQQQLQMQLQQQQQQVLNKMAAGQLNNSASPQAGFSSPLNAQANVQAKANINNNNATQATTAAVAQAAVAQAAAAAAAKNNGMFSFPANQPNVPISTVTTPGGTSMSNGPLLAPNNTMPMTPNGIIPGPKPATVQSLDSDGVNRILTKRKIQEMVSQIDSSERLEPEVEDVCIPFFINYSCVLIFFGLKDSFRDC